MSVARGRFERLARVLVLAGSIVAAANTAEAQSVRISADQQRLRANRQIDPGVTQMRASVSPAPARLGQLLRYRAMLLVPGGTRVRFEPPRSGGEFSWGKPRAGRSKPGWLQAVSANQDSVWFEAPLQIFETGTIAVPGPVVRLDPVPGRTSAGRVSLPTVHLVVIATLTAADSNADLRNLHGPLGAPWWERVPWFWIVVALAGIALVVSLVRRWLRRKPKPRAVRPSTAAHVPVRLRLDPAAEALRALAALRARELPSAGRFGEHALELTAILRRYLESTVSTPRPGDTSGELLERLRASRLDPDDLVRLEGLLALWDRVKFARAPLTEVEAVKTEDAVEGYVRRTQDARLEAEARVRAAAATRAAAASGTPGGMPPQTPPTAPPPPVSTGVA